jgi:hypothetical protein
MTKLKMLFSLAAAAALLILPTSASAGGPQFDPSGNWFVTEGGTFVLAAEGQPTITCTGPNQQAGTFNVGSSTAGEISLTLTNCHRTTFGVTSECRTTGSALGSIVLKPIPFQTVYTTAGASKPGILLTFPKVTIECKNLVSMELTGSLMGTVTAPECGKSSSKGTFSFTATGFKQNQMQITGTGTFYDLQLRTVSGAWNTAAVTTTAPVTFKEELTLTCI